MLFQPRIECWYYDKVFLGKSFPGAAALRNRASSIEESKCPMLTQHNVHNLRLQKDRGARQADTGALS